VENCKVEV